MRGKIRNLSLCALFTALTAVLSQVALSFGPIPFNLGTLAVFLAGGFLGARWGAASQAVYLLLGAVGIPVFSHFRSGIGMLLGPTGGYIWGYIAAAFLIGLLIRRLGSGYCMLACSMAAGLAACYMLGTLWYMVSAHVGLLPALSACVLPFLPVDACKILVAAFLVRRLSPILTRIQTAQQYSYAEIHSTSED